MVGQQDRFNSLAKSDIWCQQLIKAHCLLCSEVILINYVQCNSEISNNISVPTLNGIPPVFPEEELHCLNLQSSKESSQDNTGSLFAVLRVRLSVLEQEGVRSPVSSA